MSRNRVTLFAVLFLMIFNILVPVLCAQQPLSGMNEEERSKKIKDARQKHREEKEKTRHSKIDPILTDLEDEYNKGAEEAGKKFAAGEVLKGKDGNIITRLEDAKKNGGGDAAKEFARKRVLKIKEGNKIFVEITLNPGITGDNFDTTLFEQLGGTVIHRGSTNYIGADILIDKIRKIADEVEEIEWIFLPSEPVPLSYRSEGLNKVGFSNYSVAGINGSGVKVAVIDLGFKGLSSAISNGDLPDNVYRSIAQRLVILSKAKNLSKTLRFTQGDKSPLTPLFQRGENNRKEVKEF